ncbi:MAG TPA: hypothetical protein VF746_04385 [Longimicrobium sp.]|jgi:probable HAF family extracellular repeat protein
MNRNALFPSTAAVLALAALGCSEPPSAPERAGPPSALLSSAADFVVLGPTDLGTFGWQHGFGFDINDRGEIAGRTDMGDPNFPDSTHAIFWSAGTGPVDLGTLGGTRSDARALNNHGVLVGMAQKPGDTSFQGHPTVWKVGSHGQLVETIELGPFAHGSAAAVNDHGVVAGFFAASPTGPPTAFTWSEKDGLSPIPPLGGARSLAGGINDFGDVVGASTVAPGSPLHAVVWWRDGAVTDVGTLGGNTQGVAINRRGEVAGFGSPCPTCQPEAFYWSAETGIVVLGTFGGFRSFAFGIDDDGRVAGWYQTADQVRHAFVWTLEGGKVELPSLGGPSTVTGAINDRGLLSGRSEDAGGTWRAVIWELEKDNS